MKITFLFLSVFCGLLSASAFAQEQPKPATEATKKANAAVLEELPFGNKQDFEDAQRGFIAPFPDNGVVKNAKGDVVYDSSHIMEAIQYCILDRNLWR